jgi:hypothetical protein
MARLRLVGAPIDHYGSRRAWKRHRRVMRRQTWVRSPASAGAHPRSAGLFALSVVAVTALVLVAILLLSQNAFAASAILL